MSSISLTKDLECLTLEALCLPFPEVTRGIGTIPKMLKSRSAMLAEDKEEEVKAKTTASLDFGKKRRNRCRGQKTLEDTNKTVGAGESVQSDIRVLPDMPAVPTPPELALLQGHEDEIAQALTAHKKSEDPASVNAGKKSRRKRGGNKRKQQISPESNSHGNEKMERPKSEEEEEDDAEDEHGMSSSERKFLWRNVTKNGWIKKCVLVDGLHEGGRPTAGDTVLVKSQGKLKDGRIIDDFPTLVFNVGEHEVIEGLDVAVQSMHKNELSILSVRPEMAYGQLGRKSDIPTGARITYLFGLLHFEKQKELSQLTWAQRRKSGQSRMRLANWWYQRKEYPVAVKCYKKALEYYNNIPTNQACSTPEEYKELLQLMEERLRVMRQVANIFKRIANMIQSGQINT